MPEPELQQLYKTWFVVARWFGSATRTHMRSVSTTAGRRDITLGGDVLLSHGEEIELQQAMVSSNITSRSVVCLRIYRHFPALMGSLGGPTATKKTLTNAARTQSGVHLAVRCSQHILGTRFWFFARHCMQNASCIACATDGNAKRPTSGYQRNGPWFRTRSEGRTRVEAVYKIDAVYLTTPDSVSVVHVLV